MTDGNDASAETNEMIDRPEQSDAPALDGSVDALVANLRAAKTQLAELLGSSGKRAADTDKNAEKADRSAA